MSKRIFTSEGAIITMEIAYINAGGDAARAAGNRAIRRVCESMYTKGPRSFAPFLRLLEKHPDPIAIIRETWVQYHLDRANEMIDNLEANNQETKQ